MFRPILLVALVAATLFAFTGTTGESEATPPGTNGKIAFVSERDGNGEVYVMNADGTGETRLTTNPATDGSPAWSPDGTKIVFASNRDGNFEIYVMNADGSGQTRLTTDPAYDGCPNWSPDSTQIAFCSQRDGTSQIYVMSDLGSGQTNLSNNAHDDYTPVWSPDGTEIVFSTDRVVGSQFTDIYKMNDDGTAQLFFCCGPATFEDRADWSPDGTKIVFSGELSSPGGNQEVFVKNADGSGIVDNLTMNGPIDFRGTWSPDGNKIVFDSNRDHPNHEIYTMNSDGSGVIRLTSNTSLEYQPMWGPLPATTRCATDETGVSLVDVTWQNDCIHVVYNFFMAGGTTLTIDPGTIVKMDGRPLGPLDTNIILDGAHLVAHGTSANPIIITSIHDDTAGSDDTDGISQAPAPGDWKNIMVTNDGHGNDGTIDLDYVVVKYGGSCRAMITNQYQGSTCTQYVNFGTETNIDHSAIQCSLTDGIHLDNSANLTISRSVIASNGGYGVFFDGSPDATARDNWWGAADGPGPVETGSGDRVSTNVDSSGWLSSAPSAPPTSPCSAPLGVGGTTELLVSGGSSKSSIWLVLALAATVLPLGVAVVGTYRLMKR